MRERRRFLCVLGAGAAGLVVSCGGGDDGASEATGSFSAGNVSALAVGDLKAVPGQPVAVGRDDGGVYAVSTICSHERCDMVAHGTVTGTGMRCDCHSSSFDRFGTRISGPAPSGTLKHYAVTVDGSGNIMVNASQTVATGMRASV
jgi:nitrite reductase/ring-hydroxylating ferredoxin subunit